MAENIGDAQLNVTADASDVTRKLDDLVRKVEKQGQQLNRSLWLTSTNLSDQLGRMIRITFNAMLTIIGIQAVRALQKFVSESVTAAREMEQGLTEAMTLIDQGGEGFQHRFEGMRMQVLHLNREMGVLSKDSVPALYQALSAGISRQNVFDFMQVATKLAIAGVSDLQTAVDGLTSVVNAYGEANISAKEAADTLFTAVRLGKTTVDEFSQFLFQSIPIAASLGVAFEDVSAALVSLTAQGTPTRVAFTQIRQLLNNLSRDAARHDSAFKMFERASGITFPEFVKRGGNLSEAMVLIAGAAKESDITLNQMFTSIEAGQAAMQLATDVGMERFHNALVEMKDSSGAVETAFQMMERTHARSFEKMASNWEAFKIEVGTPILDWLASLFDLLVKIREGSEVMFGSRGQITTMADITARNILGMSPAVQRRTLQDPASATILQAIIGRPGDAPEIARARVSEIQRIARRDIESGWALYLREVMRWIREGGPERLGLTQSDLMSLRDNLGLSVESLFGEMTMLERSFIESSVRERLDLYNLLTEKIGVVEARDTSEAADRSRLEAEAARRIQEALARLRREIESGLDRLPRVDLMSRAGFDLRAGLEEMIEEIGVHDAYLGWLYSQQLKKVLTEMGSQGAETVRRASLAGGALGLIRKALMDSLIPDSAELEGFATLQEFLDEMDRVAIRVDTTFRRRLDQDVQRLLNAATQMRQQHLQEMISLNDEIQRLLNAATQWQDRQFREDINSRRQYQDEIQRLLNAATQMRQKHLQEEINARRQYQDEIQRLLTAATQWQDRQFQEDISARRQHNDEIQKLLNAAIQMRQQHMQEEIALRRAQSIEIQRLLSLAAEWQDRQFREDINARRQHNDEIQRLLNGATQMRQKHLQEEIALRRAQSIEIQRLLNAATQWQDRQFREDINTRRQYQDEIQRLLNAATQWQDRQFREDINSRRQYQDEIQRLLNAATQMRQKHLQEEIALRRAQSIEIQKFLRLATELQQRQLQEQTKELEAQANAVRTLTDTYRELSSVLGQLASLSRQVFGESGEIPTGIIQAGAAVADFIAGISQLRSEMLQAGQDAHQAAKDAGQTSVQAFQAASAAVTAFAASVQTALGVIGLFLALFSASVAIGQAIQKAQDEARAEYMKGLASAQGDEWLDNNIAFYKAIGWTATAAVLEAEKARRKKLKEEQEKIDLETRMGGAFGFGEDRPEAPLIGLSASLGAQVAFSRPILDAAIRFERGMDVFEGVMSQMLAFLREWRETMDYQGADAV